VLSYIAVSVNNVSRNVVVIDDDDDIVILPKTLRSLDTIIVISAFTDSEAICFPQGKPGYIFIDISMLRAMGPNVPGSAYCYAHPKYPM
jgi:hypothetical protein